MKGQQITRRDFIRLSVLAAGGAAMASCSQPTPTPTEAVAPTTAPTATKPPTATVAPTATPVPPTDTPVPPPPTAEELILKAGLPLPGLPNHPKGWKVTFPDLPPGFPMDPIMKLTSNRFVGSDVVFAEGDDINNNPFTRYAKALFGIEWSAKWTSVTGEDEAPKRTLAFASGDLPDMMTWLSGDELVQALEADLLVDLTDAIENYASQKWVKDVWAKYDPWPWYYARHNGRIIGWPYTEQSVQNDKLMWIREDWLEKVGMAVPTTLDELYEVAKAFRKADLGQGAPGTTLGIAFQQELVSWYGSADPIVGSIAGTLPNYWTENDKGDLENGSINPKMKDALAYLARWYKDGLLPADFATRPTVEAQKLVAGNLCGIHFTAHWDAGWGCGESTTNDPEARWWAYDIPAGPADRKKLWTNPFTSAVFPVMKVAPEGAADAYVKQSSWLVEWVENPENRTHGNVDIENYTFEVVDGKFKPIQNVYFPKWVYGPILSNGNGGVNPDRAYEQLKLRLSWKDIPAEKRDIYQAYFAEQYEDPRSVQSRAAAAHMLATEKSMDEGIKNMFNSPPTPTMIERGADLNALWAETWVGIVTGQKDLNAFDEFVTQWKELGGDQITAEVNDWWHARG